MCLIWRGAYLGSDLQLLGSWTGPNRQCCFVACGDNSLGSESLTLGAHVRGLQYLSCLSVCLCVCVCVCFPYSGTSRNQAYKQQYQRLQRDTGMKYKKGFFFKTLRSEVWRRLLPSSSSGVVSGMLVPFFRRN